MNNVEDVVRCDRCYASLYDENLNFIDENGSLIKYEPPIYRKAFCNKCLSNFKEYNGSSK